MAEWFIAIFVLVVYGALIFGFGYFKGLEDQDINVCTRAHRDEL